MTLCRVSLGPPFQTVGRGPTYKNMAAPDNPPYIATIQTPGSPMHCRRSLLLTPFLLCALALPALAAETPPGHSMHGDAFDEGPRQAAYLMPNVGKVSFPISTSSPDAQKFFNQGVAQLHGFWYFEAERSFRQAASLDPESPMPYWGMAMANINNDKRARDFIAEAAKRKSKASKRETLWIDGLHEYYHGKEKDDAKRRRAHVRSIESIVHEFPDDIEAKALLAWRIWDNRNKVPISSHQSVDAILDQVFAAEPLHPAHHYRIHLWDDEKASRALSAAARCGPSAPGIAHMWHMPGHTYSKLKRHEDAAWHQEASSRVDHAHMAANRVMPHQIHNYAHNQEWCVRSLVTVGRARDAAALARNMLELPRHPKHNAVGKGGSAASHGRNRVIDVLTLHELWDDYIAIAESADLTSDETPEQRVRRLRHLGVAHAAKGNRDAANAQITALGSLRKPPSAGSTSADRLLNAVKSALPSTRPSTLPTTRPSNLEKQIDSAITHIRARQLATSEPKSALPLFKKLTDLPKEHLAQAHLAAGEIDTAIKVSREAADANKDQVYPLANHADILFRSGRTADAQEVFQRLRKLSSQTDLTVPLYSRLSPIAASLHLPQDWRLPRALPDDLLPRPSPDSLGPFRWQPSPAPDFTLASPDGKPTSLADYRGRPVLLVFYLGHGCLHCIEQLNALTPLAKDFQQAGISILALSTDSPDGLTKSLDTCKSEGGYPFPLISDPTLQAFKAYRVHDDFEKTPLHATILIDPSGGIRWQDISHEPFTDAKFLLAESKRLLAQPH